MNCANKESVDNSKMRISVCFEYPFLEINNFFNSPINHLGSCPIFCRRIHKKFYSFILEWEKFLSQTEKKSAQIYSGKNWLCIFLIFTHFVGIFFSAIFSCGCVGNQANENIHSADVISLSLALNQLNAYQAFA